MTPVVLQRHRLAAGPAAGHRRGVHHVPAGHVLPVGVAVPSAAPGHPAPEEPEAEDQGQEPARRPAAVPRLHHAPQQDRPHPAGVHRHQRVRHQHAHILPGNRRRSPPPLLAVVNVRTFDANPVRATGGGGG